MTYILITIFDSINRLVACFLCASAFFCRTQITHGPTVGTSIRLSVLGFELILCYFRNRLFFWPPSGTKTATNGKGSCRDEMEQGVRGSCASCSAIFAWL